MGMFVLTNQGERGGLGWAKGFVWFGPGVGFKVGLCLIFELGLDILISKALWLSIK